MPCQPTEHADLGESLWHWEHLYHVYIFPAGADSFMGYVMCQVHNIWLEEWTLGGFQLQVVLPEVLLHDA